MGKQTRPSRMTVGDIQKLQALVMQLLKHKCGARPDAPEVSYLDLGGLLVALEDLRNIVEAARA